MGGWVSGWLSSWLVGWFGFFVSVCFHLFIFV